MKKVLSVHTNSHAHWVGDGFPVRTLFTYNSHPKTLSPFIMLDYAGPKDFAPADKPRGVGEHPHRGFETVTIAYKGEVAHRDSAGNGGVIGEGDVQWMTAGSGILHEEFHSPEYTKKGGPFFMMQLWVNLPAKDKMTKPAYQSIVKEDIPNVELANNAGIARIIAGELNGYKGPASTFTPMNVWDVRLKAGSTTNFDLPKGWTGALVVLEGTIEVNDEAIVRDAHMAILDPEGEGVKIEANSDATILLLSGEPIDEPIVGHGPFVMNTEQEIMLAFDDFRAGKFGQM